MNAILFLSLLLLNFVSSSFGSNGIVRPVAIRPGAARSNALKHRRTSRILDFTDFDFYGEFDRHSVGSQVSGSPLNTEISDEAEAETETDYESDEQNVFDFIPQPFDEVNYGEDSEENDENTPPSSSLSDASSFLPPLQESEEPEYQQHLEQDAQNHQVKEMENGFFTQKFILPSRARTSPGTSTFLLLNLRTDIDNLDYVRKMTIKGRR